MGNKRDNNKKGYEMSNDFVLGLIMGEEDMRSDTIDELMRAGMLLPEYDWGDEKILAQRDAIYNDWCNRHPRADKSKEEFRKQYPLKVNAIERINGMTARGMIKPEEYMTIYKAIYDFTDSRFQ